MYIIAVYDVGEKRVVKMLKLCRQYLNWIQNSVFEGELTEVQLKELKYKAKEIMKRQVSQLGKLVDDLLDLTRISQNKIQLKKENLNDQRRILDDVRGNCGKRIPVRESVVPGLRAIGHPVIVGVRVERVEADIIEAEQVEFESIV